MIVMTALSIAVVFVVFKLYYALELPVAIFTFKLYFKLVIYLYNV